MIIPCIDLMGGKVVQLIQGREKALEVQTSDEMLQKFGGFSQIQVIDLDAAMGKGANDHIVEDIAGKAAARVGGGVRTLERAQQLLRQGAFRIIVGTSAFHQGGINELFLEELANGVGRERIVIALDSKGGHIVVKGWQESTTLTATDVVRKLEPYCSGFLCTYVDKEGMMQGTDLQWFAHLREATQHELTAAGGITTMEDVRALTNLHIHCAVGMAIYTGRLSLDELSEFERAAAEAQ